MSGLDVQAAWENIAAVYQRRRGAANGVISYGPLAPDEQTLQLLGEVRGLCVLDLGCGAGENTLAFAKQGAVASGIDISAQQIAAARRTASQWQTPAHFTVGPAERLPDYADGSCDLLFSVGLVPYIESIQSCLAEWRRVLRPAGRLVISMDHPLRTCFYDAENDELTPYPTRAYQDNSPLTWRFPETTTRLHTYHYTISQWTELLQGARLQLLRLMEPATPPAIADEEWPIDSPLFPMRNIPHTLIVLAQPIV
jgi:ubiquinone/menaquinone biosynthesis C-methylase UbiE